LSEQPVPAERPPMDVLMPMVIEMLERDPNERSSW
jgi:hypothetical protein